MSGTAILESKENSLSTILEKSLLSAGHLCVPYNACRRVGWVVPEQIHENLFLYRVAQRSPLSYQNHHCFTELLKTHGKHSNQATGTRRHLLCWQSCLCLTAMNFRRSKETFSQRGGQLSSYHQRRLIFIIMSLVKSECLQHICQHIHKNGEEPGGQDDLVSLVCCHSKKFMSRK